MIYLGQFVAADSVFYASNFHDDSGTIADPTSPEAQIRNPAGTWSALTTPAKQNSKTGHFGGTIDTTGYANGQFVIRMAGTVATAKTVAVEFCFSIIAAQQSGDSFAVVKSGGTGDAAAIKAKTDNLPASPASTTNITAGTITTVTTLTNLPAITSNWLTAAGIASGALDGKGNWNVGKTGYAMAGTIQSLDALSTHGDSTWATATGFATSGALSSVASDVSTIVAQTQPSVVFTVGSGSTATSLVCSSCTPAPTAVDQFNGYVMMFDLATTTTDLRGKQFRVEATTTGSTPTFTITSGDLSTAPVSGDTGIG